MYMSVLVGKPAPHFKADAVVKQDFTQVDLNDYKGKQHVLLFSIRSISRSCARPNFTRLKKN